MHALAEFVVRTGALALPVLLYSLRRSNMSIPFDWVQEIVIEWTQTTDGMNMNQLIHQRDSEDRPWRRECENTIQSIIAKCNDNQANHMTFVPSDNVYCFLLEFPWNESQIVDMISRTTSYDDRVKEIDAYHDMTRNTMRFDRIYSLRNGTRTVDKPTVMADRDRFYFMMRARRAGTKHLKSGWKMDMEGNLKEFTSECIATKDEAGSSEYKDVKISWRTRPGYRIKDVIKRRQIYRGRPLPAVVFWQTLGTHCTRHFNLSSFLGTRMTPLDAFTSTMHSIYDMD